MHPRAPVSHRRTIVESSLSQAVISRRFSHLPAESPRAAASARRSALASRSASLEKISSGPAAGSNPCINHLALRIEHWVRPGGFAPEGVGYHLAGRH